VGLLRHGKKDDSALISVLHQLPVRFLACKRLHEIRKLLVRSPPSVWNKNACACNHSPQYAFMRVVQICTNKIIIALSQRCANFPQSRNQLKILGDRRLTRRNSVLKTPKILCATVGTAVILRLGIQDLYTPALRYICLLSQ
jgi:hypothetical protein